MGIKEYITYHRIQLAKRLLKHEQLCIFQIALEVGYSTHEAFSSMFKKIENINPSTYQKIYSEKI